MKKMSFIIIVIRIGDEQRSHRDCDTLQKKMNGGNNSNVPRTTDTK